MYVCVVLGSPSKFSEFLLILLFGTVQIENVRRRHNYLPLIMELLKILATDNKLLPLIEKVGCLCLMYGTAFSISYIYISSKSIHSLLSFCLKKCFRFFEREYWMI